MTDSTVEHRLDEVLSALARRVRRLREDRDLTLVALAYESGLSESRLRALEAGRTTASLATLVALAETFEIAVADLFSDAERTPSVAGEPSSGVIPVPGEVEWGGDLPPAPWLSAAPTPAPAPTASAYVVPSEVVWGGDLPPAPWVDAVVPREMPVPGPDDRSPGSVLARRAVSDREVGERVAPTEQTWGGRLPARPRDADEAASSRSGGGQARPNGPSEPNASGPPAPPVASGRASAAAHVHRRAAEQGVGGASRYVLVAPGAGAPRELRTFADLRAGVLAGRDFRSLREFAVAAVTEADHPLPAVARVFRLPVWRLEQWVVEAGYTPR
ncbi:helix-turn-helix domain-containing protein [Microbacterium sp. NPDC090007]|uniref:helix-turn-helix domain-containing protein n=1 Tax=Microbacterium sp. NPDC090007 TaxID=3364204 RepID=UPI003807BE6B